MSLRRVPGVHRAVAVAVDRKGGNFAVIQTLPNGCLSTFPSIGASTIHSQLGSLHLEAHLSDSVHDAVLQVCRADSPFYKAIRY